MWRNFSLNLWRKRNLAWLEKTTEWCIDSASAITLGSCSMPHSEDSGYSAETLGWLNLFLCHWGNSCAILGKIKNGCIYTVWAWNYSVAYLERQYYKHLNILSPENLWSSILHQSITLGILPLGISRGSMRYWPTLEKEHWAKGRGEVIKHGQQMGKNKLCTGRKQSTIHWKYKTIDANYHVQTLLNSDGLMPKMFAESFIGKPEKKSVMKMASGLKGTKVLPYLMSWVTDTQFSAITVPYSERPVLPKPKQCTWRL